MKKILFLLVVVLMASSCQEKKMDRFEREAQEYTNKNCPQKLDQVTTLDSMVFVNDGVGEMRIYYSLLLDEEQKALFMDKLGELGDTQLKFVRNSVNFVQYKEAGIRFSYIYTDAVTGEKLVEYNFTKEQYDN